MRMKLLDIKIKDSFANTVPKEKKMNKCRNYWNTYHLQDRYIVVDYNNNLIDGYIQYLILKECGVDEVDVHISNKSKKCVKRRKTNYLSHQYYKNRDTTYIYGMHFNKKLGPFSKEYVWRVPNTWTGFENELLPGDIILVNTKYGKSPIVITKIERTDKCPVDMPVKKVYRKLGSN